MEKGNNAVQPLKNVINISKVYLVGQYFAFFALLTSFLGVSLGLLDFWADGLQVAAPMSGIAPGYSATTAGAMKQSPGRDCFGRLRRPRNDSKNRLFYSLSITIWNMIEQYN